MEGHLLEFALLLGVLGLAAVASVTLRLPVVPLYILAGVGLGGVQQPDEVVRFLGSLGVVFLLFSMGLEFSLGSLARAPHRFALAGACDWVFNFPIGLLVGRALGFDWTESLLLAGIFYMSSSAVVSKCIADFGRATRPETETVLGIMVFEDLVIAIYLIAIDSLLMASGEAMQPLDYAWALLRAGAFLAVLLFLARRFQRPLERLLDALSEESFTLSLFAFVLLIAASSQVVAGLSEAIGAFVAGLVVGSTGLKQHAADTLRPFQMLFAALFFVSFGMGIDVASVPGIALPGVLLILLGFTSKTLGGYLAGRTAGHSPAQATVVGLSLTPKGEFSILIASMAAAAATASGTTIDALTGVFVLGLSILGPVGMREADRVRDWIRLRSAARAAQVRARTAPSTPKA